VLTAIAVSSSALSQPELDLAATDAQRRIVEEIREILMQRSPNDAELIGPFTALGLSYQESGDYLLSSTVIQRALEVVRVNYGLYSLEQASLIQQLIDNEDEMGNVAVAWDLEQELLALARRNPDDLRAVPILRGIADERMHVLSRYLAGEFSPDVVLGCYYDLSPSDNVGSCHAGTRSTVFQRIVAEAQRHYADAIAVLLRNELYSSDELRELELELARGSDLIRYRKDLGDRTLDIEELHGMQHTEPWRSQIDALVQLARWDLDYSQAGLVLDKRDALDRELALRRYLDQDQYELGRLAFSRLIVYENASASSQLARINALVQLADWDLLYSRNRLALDEYRQAYELIKLEGIFQSSIEQIFSPETPVVLPVFIPNPLASAETPTSTGYIIVAFEITKFGRSRRIEILASSTNVTHGDTNRLVQLIKRSRFRSRMADGQNTDSSPVTLRYYLNE